MTESTRAVTESTRETGKSSRAHTEGQRTLMRRRLSQRIVTGALGMFLTN